MKRILFLAAIVLSNMLAFGQFNYRATNVVVDTTKPYVVIPANKGTVINVPGYDDTCSAIVSFPSNFRFNFNGTSFSAFRLSTNGFIRLDTAALLTSDTNYLIDPLINVIAPFNRPLKGTAGITEYRMALDTVSGERVLTIQFKNVQDYNDVPSLIQYSQMNFQIKLFETSKNIEFVYGDFLQSANSSSLIPANVGIKGSNNSASVNGYKSSTISYAATAFTDGPYDANPLSLNHFNTRNSVLPRSGVRFRFICAPVTPFDLKVDQIFTMGEIPIGFGFPHQVKARIKNVGTQAVSRVKCGLTISGANTFTDNIDTVISIAPGGTAIVSFRPIASFDNIGLDSVTVTLSRDSFTLNNSLSIDQKITPGIFSYANNIPPAGRAGYGLDQGVLLVKYYFNGSGIITSVKAHISNDPVNIGRTVFGCIQNLSGTVLGRSNDVVITASDLNNYKEFILRSPVNLSNQVYYAGLAQYRVPGISYYPLSIQNEGAVTRSGAYYSGILGGGTPIQEVATAGRFMIQAVINDGIKPFIITQPQPLALCEGAFDSLTVRATGQSISYQWYKNGVLLPNQTSAVKRFSPATISDTGTYYVKIYNAQGFVNSQTVRVTVYALPQMTTPSGTRTICGNNAVSINLTSTVIGAYYTWVAADNANVSGESTTSVTSNQISDILVNNTITPQTVSYTIRPYNNGCQGSQQSISVNVNPLPVVSISGGTSQVICSNTALNIFLNSNIPSSTTYSWFAIPNNNVTGESQAVSSANRITDLLVNNSTSNSTVTYSVTGTAFGCRGATVILSVNVELKPAIQGFTPVNPTSCATNTGSITLNGLYPSRIYSVYYKRNGISDSAFITADNSGRLVISNLSAAIYSNIYVKLGYCSSASIGPISLYDPQGPPAPSITTNSPLCSGGSLQLSAAVSPYNAGITYQWAGPNNFSSNLASNLINQVGVQASGIYAVTAKLNGCTSQQASVVVQVDSTPARPFASGPVPGCTGIPLSLNAAMPTDQAVSWKWTGPGGFISNSQNPVINNPVLADSGIYRVSVTSLAGGCLSASDSFRLQMEVSPVISGVSFVNPNACASATGSISLSGLVSGSNYFVNYTQNGVSVADTFTADGLGKIVIPDLPAGVYTGITVRSGNCASLPAGPVNLQDPNSPPPPSVISNSPVCKGGKIILVGDLSATDPVSYKWIGPGGYVSLDDTAEITNASFANNGIYSVVGIVNGCTSLAASVAVQVYSLPVQLFSTDTIRVCDTTYLLTAQTGHNSYEWNTGDTGRSILVRRTGWYHCALNADSCKSADSVYVSLLDGRILNADTSVCYSSSASIILSATASQELAGANNLITYSWDNYVGASWIQVNPFYSTTYRCVISNGITSCIDSVRITVRRPTTRIIVPQSSCSFYVWNNNTYTQSGTYTYLTTNAAGCDSTVILQNLVIKQPTSSSWFADTCDQYTWKGTTYYATGVYSYLTTNAARCDSVMVLNLTIRKKTVFILPVNACDSFSWHGQTYTQSGSYTYRSTNAVGCDSFAILSLTINHPTASVSTMANCVNYLWNDSLYTESGVYTYHAINSNGCDSVARLNLTIKRPTQSVTTVSACVSKFWNGVIYTESGTYTRTGYINTAGCDSIAILVLTINLPSASFDSVAACTNYLWNGITYTQSGIYTKISVNSVGCPDTAVLRLTIKRKTSSNSSVSICDSYFWNDSTFTQSGVYTKVLTNAVGCDSLAILTLTIRRYTSSNTVSSACYSYLWNGVIYYASGIYTYRTRNAAGCDSFAILNLSIFDRTISNTQVSACLSYTWNGAIYVQSGRYTKNFSNAAGCDSLAVLSLIIKQPTISQANVAVCDSYLWNDSTYTQSGVYTVHFLNAAGCDSSAILNLTVNPRTRSLTSWIACESYRWNGALYTASGSYTYHTTNRFGCDSAAVLALTIRKSTKSIKDTSVCEFFIWNGVGYTASGTYTHGPILNAAGCDSLAILQLSIKRNSSSLTTIESCDSLVWNGNTYYFSGTYIFHTDNAVGCDSAAVLKLKINTPTISTTYQNACLSYTWNGIEYTNSGAFIYHATNSKGCDSTAYLYLTIDSISVSRRSYLSCGNYVWNGTTYTASGIYSFRTNGSRCDSIAILNLTVGQPTSSFQHIDACNSYTWNGRTFTQSGRDTFRTLNRVGCDSTAVLELVIKRSTFSVSRDTACISKSWNGSVYTSSGTYTYGPVPNAVNCDSLAILQLVITTPTDSSLYQSACDTFRWKGVTYRQSGVYSYVTTNRRGCDSTVRLYLTLRSNTSSTSSITSCVSYLFMGNLYSSSGTYTVITTNAAGCNHYNILYLVINQPTYSRDTVAACNSYFWNGTNYTVSGNYTFNATNSLGCDSVSYLRLTIKQPVQVTISQFACNQYQWNGVLYSSSGAFTHISTGVNGCDSITRLLLTVKYSSYRNDSATACGFYGWQGSTYTQTGIYSKVIGQNVNGCDSVGILNLVITSNITVRDSVFACGSYYWSGTTYNYSGIYTVTAISNVGCDTTKILKLTVVPTPSASVSALPILCHGESTIAVVSGSGGLPPYVGTGAFIVNGGTYTFTVSDASGCSGTASITISEPPALTDYINVTPSGIGSSYGTASVVVSGGTMPYYYSWSNGSLSDTARNLPSGNIKVYVTDHNGCQIADSALVPESLISCIGFVTYPPSSWASSIVGLYGRQHLTDYFKMPDYLTAGCIAGGRIRFSDYTAVRKALMAHGAPVPLELGTDLLNPDTLQINNILAAEVLALTLNMVSDSVDEHFSPATPLLSRLTVARGPLVGKSVRFVRDQANQFLGGCISEFTGSQLLEAVKMINLNFEDGRRDLGFLYCQSSDPEPDMNTIRFNGDVSIYPNPSYGPFVVRFDIKEPSNVRLSLFDAKGALVYDHDAGFLTQGYQSVLIGGSPLPAAGIYMLKLVIGESVKTYKVMVGK